MSLEERLEQAEKLVTEVKAELAVMRAEKATKRNWPERIEAGDCFKDAEDNRIWLAISERTFCCVIGENTGVHAYGHREAWAYLGRDILTILTAAHEPTGAELVGRVCEVMGVKAGRPATAWSPTLGVTWADDDMIQSGAAAWHKDARLAK